MHYSEDSSIGLKTYELFIKSITCHHRGDLLFLLDSSGGGCQYDGKVNIEVEKKIKICSINFTDQKNQNNDSKIELQIILGKLVLGKVTFDLSKEKIKANQWNTIFKKEFNSSSSCYGVVYYKFMTCETSFIRKEDLEVHKNLKQKITQKLNSYSIILNQDKQKLQKKRIQQEKVIQQLKERVKQAEFQNVQVTKKMETHLASCKKEVRINTNLGSFAELKKSEKQIEDLKRKMFNLEEENEGLYQRINQLLKRKPTVHWNGNEIENLSICQSRTQGADQKKSLPQQESETTSLAEENKDQKSDDLAKIKLKQAVCSVMTHGMSNDKNADVKAGLKTAESMKLKKVQDSSLSKQQGSFKPKAILNQGQYNQNKQRGIHNYRKGSVSIKSKGKQAQNITNYSGGQSLLSTESLSEVKGHLQGLVKSLRIKLQAKIKQNEVLREQIAQKDLILEKAKEKENIFNKNLIFFQNEKACILSNLISSCSQNTSNSDILSVVRQVENCNKQLLKKKTQLLKEVQILKAKIANQQQNIKANLIEIKDVKNKNKDLLDQKLQRAAKQKDIKKQISNLSNCQVDFKEVSLTTRLKSQIISYEKERRAMNEQKNKLKVENQTLLQKITQKDQQNEVCFKQNTKLTESMSILLLQKQEIQTQLFKIQEQYKQSRKMNKRYNEIEKKFENLNKLALRIENELNIRIQKDDAIQLKKDMQQIVSMLFVSINDFQVQFYSVVENSLRNTFLALGKYYEQLIQIRTRRFVLKNNNQSKDCPESHLKGTLNSEQLQELKKIKQDLQGQRAARQKQIEEQVRILREKKQNRFLTFEREILSFQDGVEMIELKIKDLMAYQQNLAVFFVKQTKQYLSLQVQDKKDSQLSHINKLNEDINDKMLVKQCDNFKSVNVEIGLPMSVSVYEPLNSNQANNNEKHYQKWAENVSVVDDEGLKVTHIMKPSVFFQGINGFSQLRASLAMKATSLKEIVDQQESSSIRPFMKKGTIASITINQILSLSRQLIEERTKMRQLKLSQIEETTKLNSNLFQEKISKDMMKAKHEQRQQELQLQFERMRREHERQLKQVTKKMVDLKQMGSFKNEIMKEKEEIVEKMNLVVSELQQAGQLIKNIQKEKEQLKMENYRLQKLIGRYKERQIEMTAQIQFIRSNCEAKDKELKDLVQERIALYQKVESTYNSELKKLTNKIDRLNDDLSTEIANSANLKKERDNGIIEYQQAIERLTIECVELKENISVLMKQSKLLQQVKQSLQEENGRLKEQINFLNEKNDENELLIDKNIRAIESYEEERVEMCRMQEKICGQSVATRKQWEENIFKQRNEINKWEEAYCKLESEIKSMAEEEKLVRYELAKVKQQVQRMKGKIEEKQRQILDLQKQISVKEIQIVKLSEQLQAELRKNRQKEDKIFELQIENERLEDRMVQIEQIHNKRVKRSKILNKSRRTIHFTQEKSVLNLPVGVNASILTPRSSRKSRSHKSPSIIENQLSEMSIQDMIDAMTPINEFIEEDSLIQEFGQYSIFKLIQQIKLLKKRVAQLVQNLKAEADKNLRNNQVISQIKKMTQQMIKMKKIEKDLQAHIVRMEAKEKRNDKQLKQKKQELLEYQKRADEGVKEIINYSRLINQLQQENIKLRMEISKGNTFQNDEHVLGKQKMLQFIQKYDPNYVMQKSNCVSVEVALLKLELAGVKEELAHKCENQKRMQKKENKLSKEKYKQKYENLTKQMLTVAAAYRELEGQNSVLKTSLKKINRETNIKAAINKQQNVIFR